MLPVAKRKKKKSPYIFQFNVLIHAKFEFSLFLMLSVCDISTIFTNKKCEVKENITTIILTHLIAL